MVGAGVLSLSCGMFHIRWEPGIVVLVRSWVITLYTLWHMVKMQEMILRKRIDRCLELGQQAPGENLGLYIVVPQQPICEVGVDKMYKVKSDKSLQKIYNLACENCKNIKLTYQIAISLEDSLLLQRHTLRTKIRGRTRSRIGCRSPVQGMPSGGVLPSTMWLLTKLHVYQPQKHSLTILNNVRGILGPGRMCLLLGLPGSGKSNLLKALAGKLDKNLKVNGIVTYNGENLDSFCVQRTSAYISQTDTHIAELAVRETLDIAARWQGTNKDVAGYLKDMMRQEKERNILPNPDWCIHEGIIRSRWKAQCFSRLYPESPRNRCMRGHESW
ncbi:unnamed protein product [Linum tenue]|uniref:ABC transporter domain-containing protein n=1 Tax=Linum tenue TaxID=586396 RepID=A0AAV0HT46_9ROSI|nr:unnamed protein product [Linum tenue]